MTYLALGALVMLVCGGLWAGVVLAVAVERVAIWGRMSLDQYAVDFRRSIYRLDPMQPIMAVAACAGAVLFALQSSGNPRVLAWTGTGLIALVIVTSTTIAEPVNSKFRRLPEGTVPEGAAHYRRKWRRFHLFRTAITLAAFACLAMATVL
ncbi:DUF1772 domain-containing protein [Nonomuraea lactucae]|uniref:DUF1772 domain-containing protein n=1 Tax=Nonomuraea lactucae TaxID=2249762 RepID=UPI000DE39389|nr:DUF1772 domain-containing protein [Nonomuraea lactucae]